MKKMLFPKTGNKKKRLLRIVFFYLFEFTFISVQLVIYLQILL